MFENEKDYRKQENNIYLAKIAKNINNKIKGTEIWLIVLSIHYFNFSHSIFYLFILVAPHIETKTE